MYIYMCVCVFVRMLGYMRVCVRDSKTYWFLNLGVQITLSGRLMSQCRRKSTPGRYQPLHGPSHAHDIDDCLSARGRKPKWYSWYLLMPKLYFPLSLSSKHYPSGYWLIGTVNYSQKHGSCAGEASKTTGGRRVKQPEVGTDLPWRLAAHCWLHCIFGHSQHF